MRCNGHTAMDLMIVAVLTLMTGTVRAEVEAAVDAAPEEEATSDIDVIVLETDDHSDPTESSMISPLCYTETGLLWVCSGLTDTPMNAISECEGMSTCPSTRAGLPTMPCGSADQGIQACRFDAMCTQVFRCTAGTIHIMQCGGARYLSCFKVTADP